MTGIRNDVNINAGNLNSSIPKQNTVVTKNVNNTTNNDYIVEDFKTAKSSGSPVQTVEDAITDAGVPVKIYRNSDGFVEKIVFSDGTIAESKGIGRLRAVDLTTSKGEKIYIDKDGIHEIKNVNGKPGAELKLGHDENGNVRIIINEAAAKELGLDLPPLEEGWGSGYYWITIDVDGKATCNYGLTSSTTADISKVENYITSLQNQYQNQYEYAAGEIYGFIDKGPSEYF